MDLVNLTVEKALAQLERGELTAEALMKATLDRIARLNPRLNVFLSIDGPRALAAARDVDRARAVGTPLPPLAGIPVAVKDVLATRAFRTTAGSRMLETYRPTYDATVVQKLETAGAIVVGKTNCDEFALGASGEYSAYGPTKNPWDQARVPGGSSSGSAAAVSAGLVLAALGTDTGGSVRVPAAFTNLVGLKPTYGRVSRYGLIASTSSSDTVGVLTKTVADGARMLAVLAGRDVRDATTVNEPVPDYLAALTSAHRRFRVGVPAEYFQDGMDPEVESAVRSAIGLLGGLNCDVVEVSLPYTTSALAAYYLINPSEVSSNLARFDGIRYGRPDRPAEQFKTLSDVYAVTRKNGFGAETKRRILLGTFALSRGYVDQYYLKAQRVRTLLDQDFANAFESVDVLLTPTAPDVAFAIGAVQEPLTMYLVDVNMAAASLAGLPALSVPCGFVRGLPVGMQLIGPAFHEADLLALAARYEAETDWIERVPTVE